MFAETVAPIKHRSQNRRKACVHVTSGARKRPDMPNFENLPMNPWLLAGTAVAVITLIFYIGKWVGDINAFKSGGVSTLVNLLEEIRDDIRTLLDRVPAVHIASGSPLRRQWVSSRRWRPKSHDSVLVLRLRNACRVLDAQNAGEPSEGGRDASLQRPVAKSERRPARGVTPPVRRPACRPRGRWCRRGIGRGLGRCRGRLFRGVRGLGRWSRCGGCRFGW